MRTFSKIAMMAACLAGGSGCHLASGLDDFRVNRLEIQPPPETFPCNETEDLFESINPNLWTEALDDGVSLGFGMEGGMVLSLENAAEGSTGGLFSTEAIGFNLCSVTIEITPETMMDTRTRLVLTEEPALDVEPLIEVRRDRSRVRVMVRGDEIESIPFNGEQLFWTVFDDGSQIRFETSEMGDSFTQFSATQSPFEISKLYVGLLVESLADDTTDEVTFLSYYLTP